MGDRLAFQAYQVIQEKKKDILFARLYFNREGTNETMSSDTGLGYILDNICSGTETGCRIK